MLVCAYVRFWNFKISKSLEIAVKSILVKISSNRFILILNLNVAQFHAGII